MDDIKQKIAEDYWLKKLSPQWDVPVFPLLENLDGDAQSRTTVAVVRPVSVALTDRLDLITRGSHIGLFIFFLAAIKAALHRYTGATELIIGILPPSVGEYAGQYQNNPLYCRAEISPGAALKEMVGLVKQVVLEGFNYSDYAPEHMLERLKLNHDGQMPEIIKLAAAYDKLHSQSAPLDVFPVRFLLKRDTAGLWVEVRFSRRFAGYGEALAGRFCDFLLTVLTAIAAEPTMEIQHLPLLDEALKLEILHTFNDTAGPYPQDKVIHQLMMEQAARTPERTAIVEAGTEDSCGRLSYGQLDLWSGHLAEILRRNGIGPGNIVAVMAQRSLNMMIAIYAVLKAGCAYLPLDPDFPAERIDYMLQNCAAECLLLGDCGLEAKDFNINVIQLDPVLTSDATPLPVGAVVRLNAAPVDPAYVIYTSGSTGRPKGVLVQHHAVINRLHWMQTAYPIGSDHVILQKTPVIFDVSVWELFWWSFYGASLCLLGPGNEKSPDAIIDALQHRRISTMHFVPSMLDAFLHTLEAGDYSGCLASLVQVFASGEALLPRQVDLFYRLMKKNNSSAALINLYGPTEATVDVSYYNCPAAEQRPLIPIGKPIHNIRLYVLNRKHELLPVGVCGELHIAGVGLALGYVNNPELTAERFPEPTTAAHTSQETHTSSRTYKTGDLCRFLPDGNIQFLGRLDHQVKLRGYRIELGDIETHIHSLPAVKEVVTVLKQKAGGDAFLCAYIVAESSLTNGQVSDDPLTPTHLRDHLSLRLPQYQIPAYFVFLPQLPRTAGGKIDRKALPFPQDDDSLSGEYVAPVRPLETICVEAWQKILGLTKIGTAHNFFMIGGDSIKAIRIVAELKKAGYHTEMKHIFNHPTIAGLTPFIKKNQRIPQQSPVIGPVPPGPMQHWFFKNIYAHNGSHFNQAILLRSQARLERAVLEKVFAALMQHHDALRITVRVDDAGTIRQFNQDLSMPVSLQEIDLRHETDAASALKQHAEAIHASMQLEQGPLLKVGLFQMQEGDRLLISIHHLVVDGVSWRILLEDIQSLYLYYRQFPDALQPGRDVLPLKTDSFKLWTEAMTAYAASDALKKEAAYWLRPEKEPVRDLPVDFQQEALLEDMTAVSFKLNSDETRRLLMDVNHAFGTEVNHLLLTALGRALNVCFGVDRVAVAMEGHGREDILEDVDVSRTVGWFTSLFPVIIDVSVADLGGCLTAVKEMLNSVPNRGVGYGLLKYTAAKEMNSAFNSEPGILFNYLGRFDTDLQQAAFASASESVGGVRSRKGPAMYRLDVSAMIAGKELEIILGYCSKQYRVETMEALAAGFRRELVRLIDFCAGRTYRTRTPSDFTYKGLSSARLQRLTETYHRGETRLEDVYTLTPLQESMLYYTLAAESSSAYFQQIAYRLQGKVDIAVVEESLNRLLERRDVLRTVFVHEDLEHPLQVVLTGRKADFTFCDLRVDVPQQKRDLWVRKFKDSDRRRAFNLVEDVLIRVAVLQTDDDAYEFIWSNHHILMDGWCIGLLIADYFELYRSIQQQRPPQLPVPVPFRKYIQWLEKQDRTGSAHYWQHYLAGYPQAQGLPRKSGDAADGGYDYRQVVFALAQEPTGQLEEMAAQHQVTLNTLVQAVWGILLCKCVGSRDVVFGIAVSGRPPEIDGVEFMVGLLINSIPVRVKFDASVSFEQLLLTLQQDALAGEAHHHFPLVDVQTNWGTRGNQALLDHVLVFANFPIAQHIDKALALNSGGENDSEHRNDHKETEAEQTFSNLETFEQDNYDLSITIAPGKRLSVRIFFNGLVYDDAFIRGLSDYFNEIVKAVLENPQVLVEDIVISHDFADISVNTEELESDFNF